MARYFFHYAQLRVNLRRNNFPGGVLKKPKNVNSKDKRILKSVLETARNFHFGTFHLIPLPGKDFTPWVYTLYRVNKRVLTRKIGQFRVTLRDITP
jgi:hypothetical protein